MNYILLVSPTNSALNIDRKTSSDSKDTTNSDKVFKEKKVFYSTGICYNLQTLLILFKSTVLKWASETCKGSVITLYEDGKKIGKNIFIFYKKFDITRFALKQYETLIYFNLISDPQILTLIRPINLKPSFWSITPKHVNFCW